LLSLVGKRLARHLGPHQQKKVMKREVEMIEARGAYAAMTHNAARSHPYIFSYEAMCAIAASTHRLLLHA
jgi:hypothetical protein